MKRLRQVRKRDGRLVPFDRTKIADAIFRAAQSVGGDDRFLAEELAGVVVARLHALLADRSASAVAGIEDVQDLVERVLIDAGHARTAKAFILYRERRAEARAARARLQGGEGERAPTLVGGDAPARAGRSEPGIRRFSKAQVSDRLVREQAMERPEAEAVARAVEERVLRVGSVRLGEDLLDTLVRAELFDRGWTLRAQRPARDVLGAAGVQSLLERGPDDRRATDPAAVAESVGEALCAQHVLHHLLAPAVAEAQRVGDVHVYDLGAPLRLTAIALCAPSTAAARLAGEGFSRPGGVRRSFAVLEELLLAYAPHAARALALEDVNVWLAPFVAHLDEEALAEEVRQFLLSPALAAAPRRGGLLRLELGLAAEVPPRVGCLPTPEPSPPGRRFGDYAETAFLVARTFLREAAALRRAGHWVECALTLVLPRGGARDASRRALVRQALASAGEGGEPVILFEDPARPTRGSRWFRLTESESPDPLRFDRGDVSASGAVALNLVGAALRTRRAGLEDFIRELDRLVRLGLDALAARRDLREGSGDVPGSQVPGSQVPGSQVPGSQAPGVLLPALRRGVHPLVDLEASFQLVELVGADRAAALLLPRAEAVERLGMRERIVRHLHGRVREEALARRLHAAVAEGLDGEAARRFARCDAERYPGAGDWWPAGHEPSYAAPRGGGSGPTREPLHPDRLRGGPSLLRVRHRVHGEHGPRLEDLVRALEAAERDEAVLEYAVDPWPRRLVHREPPVV